MKQVGFAAAIVIAGQGAFAQDATIVAVNYPLQFLAERLVGDAAEVVFPVPADVDPSFWRPSISDISMIQSADLILLNGAGFASWVDRVSLPRSKVVTTTSGLEARFIPTETITHSHGDGGEHSHEGVASYVWLDPMLAASQAEVVAGAITARGLAPAADVEDSLAALTADLTSLHDDISALLGDAQDIAMITTHPRYQYFAQAYDLQVSALEWEAGAAPSAEELSTLEAMIAETGAQVLIWEAAPPESAFAATAALGVENIVFSPMAQPVDGADFITAYKDAVTALSATITALTQ